MAKKAVNDAVHKLQLCLLEGIETEKQLLAAGSLMSRSDYADVVTERSIAELCGYPLCRNPLPPADSRKRKGRYRISLKEHKVYDVHEMYLYCSKPCLVNSKAFSGSLNEERCAVLNPKKLEEVLSLFDTSKVEEDVESKIVELFDGLKVHENENVESKAAGEVNAGPSNAIEGYVPLDRSRIKSSIMNKEGDNAKTKNSNSKKDSFFNEMDFMSIIITNDEYTISKTPCGSTEISSNSKFGESKGKGGRNLEDRCNKSGSLASIKDGTGTTLRESTGKSKIVVKGKLGAQEMPSASVPCKIGSSISTIEAEKESYVEKKSISGAAMPKSSLKSSGSKKLGHSVTWADEKIDSSGSSNLCEVRDVDFEANVDNDDDMLRLASAEACAMALSEAAGTVASGDFDVTDAVSEAGIIILPCPLDVDEAKSTEDSDAPEPESVPKKWPSKPDIPRSDMFDPEDSWYDAPPEGFSLTLSPFATMWMAIFSWITSSSLAYIYGRDESFHEEYVFVNGREYPRKSVFADGRSSEIMQTLAGCLSRALPGLVTDLRLPTPVSTLEKGVERLLNTMSFIDPLPPFRMKEWQVIALLLIDALSVCKIPTLTPHMRNRTMLIRKVLDGGQISAEEYEVMKDFIMPLGRAPQFSTQSGA